MHISNTDKTRSIEDSMAIQIIYLDMDGVLFDFVGSVTKKIEQLPEIDLKKPIHKWFGMSATKFWKYTDTMEFWTNMGLYPGVKTLVERLNIKYKVYFCSTPTLCPYSVSGKLFAIQKHFPGLHRNFVFTPAKELLVDNNTIFIDDRFQVTEKIDLMIKKNNCYNAKTFLVKRAWNRSQNTFEDIVNMLTR